MARESQASRKSGLPYIYGGISFLKGETNLVWYPSNGFQSPQGILLACYNTGDDARRFGALPVSDQYARRVVR
jgi:monoamine oxidase